MRIKVGCDDNQFRWDWFTIPGDDIHGWLKNHVWDQYRIFDADHGGTDQFTFVIVDDRGNKSFYAVTHSWDIERDPDWKLTNYFAVETIDAERARQRIINNNHKGEQLWHTIV